MGDDIIGNGKFCEYPPFDLEACVKAKKFVDPLYITGGTHSNYAHGAVNHGFQGVRLFINLRVPPKSNMALIHVIRLCASKNAWGLRVSNVTPC